LLAHALQKIILINLLTSLIDLFKSSKQCAYENGIWLPGAGPGTCALPETQGTHSVMDGKCEEPNKPCEGKGVTFNQARDLCKSAGEVVENKIT